LLDSDRQRLNGLCPVHVFMGKSQNPYKIEGFGGYYRGWIFKTFVLFALVMNIARIWAIGSNVFREVFRERVLYIAALYGVALVIAVGLRARLV
jgi:hypothetical protein